jgi:hypothetical protein
MYRRLLVRRWFVAVALVAIVAISAEIAFAQGPVVSGPTSILNQYRSVRTTWLTTAAGYANRLFGILALIEFA